MCALDPAGRRVHDKALPNGWTALRRVFTDVGTRGPVLVVVDQPASIGALAIGVARAMSIDVALFAMLRSGQPYRPPVGDDTKPAAAAA